MPLFFVMSENPPPLPARKRKIITPGFDPQIQPVLPPLSALGSLPEQALNLDFIKAAFSQPVAWEVEPVFSDAFRIDADALSQVVQAAVLMPLVQRDGGLNVIFTRRAAHLYDHAGQISFPGGRIEATDANALAAALRETHEEIGVEPHFVQTIGTHPCFLTATGFSMEPVIGLVQPGFVFRPDATEVAEVFEVPLAFLMDPANHHLHRAELPGGGQRLYYSMPWGQYFIWGATAALVRNLYHHLAAAHKLLAAR